MDTCGGIRGLFASLFHNRGDGDRNGDGDRQVRPPARAFHMCCVPGSRIHFNFANAGPMATLSVLWTNIWNWDERHMGASSISDFSLVYPEEGSSNGYCHFGGGLGAFIGPPVITWLINIYSWMKATLILGIFILVAVLIAAQFLKRDPSKIGQKPYGGNNVQGENLEYSNRDFSLKEAIGTMQFWTIIAMFFCLSFYTFSVMVHYVPHAIRIGITPESAAYILACISGVSIAGNYVMGLIGDKIGPRKVFIVSFVLMSGALFWLVQAREVWMLYVFSVVFGFNHGGNATAQAPLLARIFGLRAHGKIFAAAAFGFTIGGAAGPLATGYIYDISGDYIPAFILCGIMGVIGLVLAAILRPTKRITTTI